MVAFAAVDDVVETVDAEGKETVGFVVAVVAAFVQLHCQLVVGGLREVLRGARETMWGWP